MSNRQLDDEDFKEELDNSHILEYEQELMESSDINPPRKLSKKLSIKPRYFLTRGKNESARDIQEGLLPDEQQLVEYESLLESDPDFFKVPADLQLAKRTANLKRISEQDKPFPEGKLPLFVSKDVLKEHSTSYFLYFEFMEECIIAMFIVFFVSCVFDLFAVTMLSTDRRGVTHDDILHSLNQLSILDQKIPDYVISIKLVLNLLSIIATKLFFLSREVRRKSTYSEDYLTFTENDFSVLVNLLPNQTTMEEVHQYFSATCEKYGYGSVNYVLILENLHEILKLKMKKKNIVQSYIKSKRYENNNRKHKLHQIQKIDEKILEIRLKQTKNKDIKKSAIVVFEDPRVNNILIQTWLKIGACTRLWIRCVRRFKPSYKSHLNYKKEMITIKKCGEPADVIFPNLAIPASRRNKRKYLSITTVTVLILLFPTFAITYQLLFWIDLNGEGIKPKETRLTFVGTFLYAGLSLLIYLAIKLIVIILSKTQLMRRKSDTEKFKLVSALILTLINYNLLLVAKLLTYGKDHSPYVNDLFMLMAGMLIMPQIVELLDPEFLYKYVRRKMLRKAGKSNDFSQSEAEELYENPSYDYSARVNNCAQIIYISLSTYMFLPIIPIIGVLALCCAYVVDRYLILRRCPKLTVRGFELGLYCFKSFRYDILAQSIGNVVLCVYLFFQNQLSVFNMIIGSLFVLLNGVYMACGNHTIMSQLSREYVRRRMGSKQKGFSLYSQAKQKFNESYYQEYKSFLRKHDLLSLMK